MVTEIKINILKNILSIICRSGKNFDITELFHLEQNSEEQKYILKTDKDVYCVVTDNEWRYKSHLAAHNTVYTKDLLLQDVLKNLLDKYLNYHQTRIDNIRKMGYLNDDYSGVRIQ